MREELTYSTSERYPIELLNAALFTPALGTITLAYCIIEQNRRILFSVTNTGYGIPTAPSEQIFERFVKLDNVGPGLGLGRSVCCLIAQSLGGTLQLDTTYTSGARFTV